MPNHFIDTTIINGKKFIKVEDLVDYLTVSIYEIKSEDIKVFDDLTGKEGVMRGLRIFKDLLSDNIGA